MEKILKIENSEKNFNGQKRIDCRVWCKESSEWEYYDKYCFNLYEKMENGHKICYYTGFKDANGVKLYENSFVYFYVKQNNPHEMMEVSGIVVFSDNLGAWVIATYNEETDTYDYNENSTLYSMLAFHNNTEHLKSLGFSEWQSENSKIIVDYTKII
jgi:hypothetical protein